MENVSIRNDVNERMEEYLELQCFIQEAEKWESQLVIIRKENWNEFFSSNDEEREMKIEDYLDASDFFDSFGQVVGHDDLELKDIFVNWKYIDEQTYNTIELVVDIDNKEEIFIIDVV